VTEAEANLAILQQWEAGWGALHGAGAEYVPTTYDNEAYEKDDLGALGAWARVSLRHSVRSQRTMGSAPYRKFESRGYVFVQIFAPIDNGRALRSRLADDVRTVLEGQRLGELLLHEATTRDEREDGVWSMSTIVVEFRYTDTR
jgi:hypothetical protein